MDSTKIAHKLAVEQNIVANKDADTSKEDILAKNLITIKLIVISKHIIEMFQFNTKIKLKVNLY